MNKPLTEDFYIFDGTSLVYRSFYAIRDLRNSKGAPTNAVFGFIKILTKFIREKSPKYLVMVFDAKGPTFRHEQFKDYKIHRKPMPDELVAQLPWIKALVEAYRIPTLEISGFEADDVIATLALQAKKEFNVFIISPDKDILQLVDSRIKVISNPADDSVTEEKDVTEKYGIYPGQIIDYLALTGDASDNIPGVPGIGSKTASFLLKEFESLEKIFSEPWSQKGKTQKEKILPHQEIAKLSKILATLRRDVPIPLKLSEAQIQKPNQDQLSKLYQELEFRDLLKETAVTASKKHEILMITDIKTAQKAEHEIHQAKKIGIALHLERTDLLSEPLQGIAVATPKQKAFYFPLHQKNEIDMVIKNLLEEPLILKTGYDLKNTLLMLNSHSNIKLKGLQFDTLIAAFLTNPSVHYKDFSDLIAFFLKTSFDAQGSDPQTACSKALFNLELEHPLTKSLQGSDQLDLFQNIEIPLIEILADMEKTGIPLDAHKLKIMSQKFALLLKELEKNIHQIAGQSFNINSPKELARILFEKLKLPAGRKTKTGYSTDAEVLSNLSKNYEIALKILDYRQISKLKSTYVDSLPEMIHPKTGRIHTTFSQTVAETGRLASSNPNLQNIPIRSPLGKEIRGAFVSPDNQHLLLSADYSQVELRILAHFSEDPGLLEAFEKDEDIHRWTAQAIFNVPAEEVSDEMRSRAKAINFGIVYGMSPFGLSKELNIPMNEAHHFIDQYRHRFSKVQNFIDHNLEKAKSLGYVTTLFKRRRYLPELQNPQPQIRQMAERMAINTPIQGTAADLIKMAMIRIGHHLQENHFKAKLILQIHDELILIIPKTETEAVQELVREQMENIYPLKVKLKVDLHTGSNWMEL